MPVQAVIPVAHIDIRIKTQQVKIPDDAASYSRKR